MNQWTTQDSSDRIFEIVEQFYIDFSRLVNLTLRKVPESYREELKEKLQEKTSVYGRKEDA